MDNREVADRAASWPVLGSRDIHRDDWVVAVREDTVTRPDHPDEPFVRLVVEHPGAVVVLAVDEDERVVCLRQYRHVTGHEHIELPAGLRDAGDEPPVETAKRELLEEVELEAGQWRHLLSTFPSAGIIDEVHEIFLATDLRPSSRGDFDPHHEEAEMEVLRVPMADLLDAVLAGAVREGPLVQAVLAYDVLKTRGSLG